MSAQDICNYYGIMTGSHMVTIPEQWNLSAYISLPTIATLNDLKGLLEEHESVTSVKVKMSGSSKQCRFPRRLIKTTAENVLSFLGTQSPSRSTTVSYLSLCRLSRLAPLRGNRKPTDARHHLYILPAPSIPDRTCIQTSTMPPPAFTHMKERHTADHTDDINFIWFSICFCLDLCVVFLLKIRVRHDFFLHPSL